MTKLDFNKNSTLLIIIFLLFFITFLFLIFVFYLYLYPTLVALILYVATRKPFKFLKKTLKSKFEFLVPWIMLLLVGTTLIVPLYFIFQTILYQAQGTLIKLKQALGNDDLIETFMNIPYVTDFFTSKEFFWIYIPELYHEFSSKTIDVLDIDNLVQVLTNASSIILGTIDFPMELAGNLFFTSLVLFFLYKDGLAIERFMLNNLPLSKEIEEQIIKRLTSAVHTVLKGNLLISILQSLVIYILLMIVGIQTPFLYSIIAGFFSLIPLIGTAVIWLPIGLYMFFIENNWIIAIIFMAVSFASYLILENVMKPKLLDKKLNVHPFLIFLSLIGGIKEFGILGLVIGPVALTFLIILWDFWKSFRKTHLVN